MNPALFLHTQATICHCVNCRVCIKVKCSAKVLKQGMRCRERQMGAKFVTTCRSFQVNSLKRWVFAQFSPPPGYHLPSRKLCQMLPIDTRCAPCKIWREAQGASNGNPICHHLLHSRQTCVSTQFLCPQAFIFHWVNCTRCVI